MKPEEQIKALAELDGWIPVLCKVQEWNEELGAYTQVQKQLFERQLAVCLERVSEKKLPPYLTSYDAIIPLIQKCTNDTKRDMFYLLIQAHGLTIEVLPYETQIRITHLQFAQVMFDSTSAQLCEALLRSTEKWKE
jgi:hypothetical protein